MRESKSRAKTGAERARTYRQRLDKVAMRHGFAKWSDLQRAILNSEACVIKVITKKTGSKSG